MFIRRRKIKLKDKSYYICVGTYKNNRIRLRYKNASESHDITLDLEDAYIDAGKVILDPAIKNNGLLKMLRKCRIIKDVVGYVNYNYIELPVAILNMGILKRYDYDGVMKHFEKVMSNE